MLIGNNIEDIRTAKKLLQKDVAEGCGLTVSGYQKAIFNNDFKVSTIIKIAEFLKVPVTSLFDKEIKSTSNSDCELCSQKDELITALKQTIDAKEELIQSLKARLEIQQSIIDKKAAS